MPGKDGMSLLYVPAGEFTMSREDSRDDEKPIHTVDLDAFWIDQTEVTLHMFYLCVNAGVCEEPSSKESDTRSNYPVINVSWNDANNDYCS